MSDVIACIELTITITSLSKKTLTILNITALSNIVLLLFFSSATNGRTFSIDKNNYFNFY